MRHFSLEKLDYDEQREERGKKREEGRMEGWKEGVFFLGLEMTINTQFSLDL